MRSVLIAALLICAVGCRPAPEPSAAPSAAAVSPTAVALVDTPSSLRLDHTQRGWCPIQWTCTTVRYYSLKSACEAACGVGVCFQEPHCDGTCMCQ